jgi:hypothetical protein
MWYGGKNFMGAYADFEPWELPAEPPKADTLMRLRIERYEVLEKKRLERERLEAQHAPIYDRLRRKFEWKNGGPEP